MIRNILPFAALAIGVLCTSLATAANADRPNILFAISDDQSFPHAGAYGAKQVETPAFDRVAKAGVLFTQAFTACPSCAPSRAAILTGQDIWRLEEGSLLFGALPAKFSVYPQMLGAAGYHLGHTGKTNEPWSMKAGGWETHPSGKAYRQRKLKEKRRLTISSNDYAANFIDFLDEAPADKPFCFWYGATEPHRAYRAGSGVAAGKKLADVEVPSFLPDNQVVRSDLLDYYLEIEHFDQHLGRMLDELERRKLLDNTLVVVTSDNGLPFPRAKTNLYEYGVHMPLAISWPAKAEGNRVIDDLVSLTDLAPTFLDAAGLEVPEEMTGSTLLWMLTSGLAGRVDPNRDAAYFAMERHTWCRPEGKPYPMRAIRTNDFLYIRNLEPDRWPAGNPDFKSPHQGVYGDIDGSPTKTFMLEHRADNAAAQHLFDLSFGKRVEEELYDIRTDPGCLNNLAEQTKYYSKLEHLRGRLDSRMFLGHDPRAKGESPWDDYPYYFRDFWKRAPGANAP